jgi:cell division protein FtsQ
MAIAGFTIAKSGKPRQNRPLEEEKVKKSRRFALPAIRLSGFARYSLMAVTVLALLGVANGFQKNLSCKDIQVNISASGDNQFLTMNDVRKMIGLDYGKDLIGEKMENIELIQVENSLRNSPFIREAEVYKSMRGVLFVDVEIREPIARMMNNDGSSLYLDSEGVRFPTTPNHTANVVLVRGNFNESVNDPEREECGSIVDIALPVLRFISGDPFWNAMISEVVISEKGEIELIPQMGDIAMELGTPARLEEKFSHLRLFYDQVVKKIGWDKYKSVSVKYRGQVIARR